MKKNVSNQSMDATLQTFLGNLSSKETPKSEPQPADTQEQASETVQKTVNEPMPEQPDETPQTFLPVPSIEDRKPVFLSRSTRDALDRIVRMFGERKMSVSGLVENIARQHLAIYGEDIEAWRKL